MPETDEIAFLYPSGGMNGAGCSTRLPPEQYRRATNVTLQDELPSTRPRVRIYDLEPAKEGSLDAEFFAVNNVQGAHFFNPAKGQGGLIIAESNSQIMVACGGRKFSITLNGTGASTRALIKDLSGEFVTSRMLHLVWWVSAENYAIAGDGSSNSFIWDGATNARIPSPGYDSVDKETSRLPNGGTVMVYAHGRIMMVVNSRQILVGDSIHKTDISSSDNLLDSTEQVYWNTGTYFLPPSAMGAVRAADILPIRNTQHGHGDVMFHCDEGVFSIDINQTPRSEWANRQLVRCALLQAGAVGPYALSLRDGDQIYRTRHGITTLRSAAANNDAEGNPQTPLSEPVRTFLEGDVTEWLRFCSLVVWEAQRRLLCTIDPCMDGRFRWHRALLLRNFNPAPVERSPACWEGIWTLPPQAWGIVQLVSGIFAASERLFGLCRGEDGRNRLVEFTGETGDDILPDGSRRPIRCQLITRAVDLQRPFLSKEFVSGTLFLRNVRGKLTWGVWVRRHEATEFTFWKSGTVDVAETVDAGLLGAEPLSAGIALGNFPKECATGQGRGRSYEFLIRWQGVAQIEGLRIMGNIGDEKAEIVDVSDFSLSSAVPLGNEYDDFEYSSDRNWIDTLPTT